MKIYFIMFFLITIPLFSTGQEKGFYDIDNSYHQLYSDLKVKSFNAKITEYDNGELSNQYLQLVQDFNKEGYIIREREYYSSDTTAGSNAKFKYNEAHKIIRVEWDWLLDNETDITDYKYDSSNRLIEDCTFDTEFELNECSVYYYKNDSIDRITTRDGDLIWSFKRENNLVSAYYWGTELEYKYKDGDFIYQKNDSIIYNYKRNKIGQILEVVKTDIQENLLSMSIYTYKNDLLNRVVTVDTAGLIINRKEYSYEFYE